MSDDLSWRWGTAADARADDERWEAMWQDAVDGAAKIAFQFNEDYQVHDLRPKVTYVKTTDSDGWPLIAFQIAVAIPTDFDAATYPAQHVRFLVHALRDRIEASPVDAVDWTTTVLSADTVR